MSKSLLLRSLILYGVCAVIALFVGYQVTSWDEMMGFGLLMAVLMLMLVPLLLKWHHVWLIASWNTTAFLFFLPGKPTLVLVLSGCSLLISLLHHAINQEAPFIHVRILFWPLLFLTFVVLATAKLTGGIGLNIAGSSNVGGKRYIFMFGAILGYFALTAQLIPRDKVIRYATIFFASPVTSFISDISLFMGPSAVYYIFLLFPSSGMMDSDVGSGAGPAEIARFGGTALACSALVYTMMARYGLRGIFNSGKVWRVPAFMLLFAVSLMGGYRSTLLMFVMTFGVMFWLERLYTSRLMPVMLCGFLLMAVAAIPLAAHLPDSMQRTLTVVPFLKVGDDAERSAKDSSEWRIQMWKEVVPEIPHYLIVGKGYSIDLVELKKINSKALGNTGEEGSMMAGDYHNGPLSVIIPFGIAGCVAFLWLIGAGIKVLYNNFKHGDPAFRNINTYLLAAFITKAIFFLGVFGSFYSDLVGFTGLLGLSVAINNGMRKPARVPQKRVTDAWKVAQAQPVALN